MDNRVYIYKQSPDYSVLNKKGKLDADFLLKQLDELIKPGDNIVIKPNFVKESHLLKTAEWEYIITHTEIIRLVLERAILNLKEEGEINIVDAPQTDSDWEEIIKRVHLTELVEEFQAKTKIKISCFDLREERWFYKQGIIVKRKKLIGDPRGYTKINLTRCSEFFKKQNKEYYGADYDMQETKQYHNEQDNIYVISNTVLQCDLFINLPKLKTHKLAGMTACLKNLVGTCVIKNSIPHHTIGSPKSNGDKFQKESRRTNSESNLKAIALSLLKSKNPVINYPFILIKKIAGLFFGQPQSDVIRNGAWYGNDTIWRAVLDLNKIVLYADKNGNMHDVPQRKYFALIDGIIGGEGKGPMEPDPKFSGVIIAGTNPVYTDTVAATIMGFDYRKIPTIAKSYCIKDYPLVQIKPEEIEVVSTNELWNISVDKIKYKDTLKYKPHFGWINNIELEK